jgi:DNA-binding response OmpR family regulator
MEADMARRTILVIEDDAAIRRGLVDAMEFAGYAVIEAGDARKGLEQALQGTWDLLLLDLVLPGRVAQPPSAVSRAASATGGPSVVSGAPGLDILQQVREHRPTLPVIVLTAMGAEGDRVKGLRLGADDYMVKPFSIKELLARVEAVLRRSPERMSDVRHVPLPHGTADLQRREVQFTDGGRCELSEREAELLHYLACNAGRAISREEILRRVWHLEPGGLDTRTIDMHVARLREKLRDDVADPRVLLTVRGKGYMIADNNHE